MPHDPDTVLIVADPDGTYYALSRQMLDLARVPDERKAEVSRLIGGDDVGGFVAGRVSGDFFGAKSAVRPWNAREMRGEQADEHSRPPAALPGSTGEHLLQERYGTSARACAFYDKQMLDHLNEVMRDFIAHQEMLFIATADGQGDCDASFRAGPPGLVRVLDERTLTWPEYRGNGVHASLGNIVENPHIGLLFIDFFDTTIGLHINGRVRIVENEEMLGRADLPPAIREDITVTGGRKPERWLMVEVQEAYIHCAKHIPLLTKAEKDIAWGTDDVARKGGDHFHAADEARSWAAASKPA